MLSSVKDISVSHNSVTDGSDGLHMRQTGYCVTATLWTQRTPPWLRSKSLHGAAYVIGL